jgi:hypothetical protein
METKSSVDSSPLVTQDYGHGVKVTTGGVYESGYRVYTVRFGKSAYKIVPQRRWFPRLAIGSVDCRMKKDYIIVRDGYHYSIVAELSAQ